MVSSRLRVRSRVAMVVLAAFAAMILPSVPAAAQPGWLGGGWQYRRAVVVQNTSAQDLVSQQVYVTLTGSGFDFTHSTAVDMRVTDSDGTTLLNHWIDGYSALWKGGSLVVSVPLVPASSTKTIYLYYGNPLARNTSSGPKTFVFFDGFERLRNAQAPLVIPTYDGSGQLTHPDVVEFPAPWNGFRYWMAMTPYPNGNDRLENPSILASNDGLSWVVPPGAANPLVPAPPCDHNNDPDMLYNPATGELWMYYLDTRRASRCAAFSNQPFYDHNYMKLIKSRDGVHWTSPVTVIDWSLATEPLYISPTVAKVGSTFHLWAVNSATYKARYAQSATGTSFGSSQAVNVSYAAWHFDIEHVADRGEYWMFLDYPNKGTGKIWFARSADRVNWTTYPLPVLTGTTGWDQNLYRSTFTFDPQSNQIRLWYAAVNDTKVWRTGHSGADHADMLNQLVAAGGWQREQGTGTWSTSTAQVRRGDLSANVVQSAGTSMALSKPSRIANDLLFEYDLYDDMDTTAFKVLRLTNSADNRVGAGVWTGASSTRYVFHDKAYGYRVSSVARTKGWHRFGVLVKADGSVTYYVDGTNAGTNTGQFANVSQVHVDGYQGGTTSYFVDDLRIRKWAGFEPPTSLGPEETR